METPVFALLNFTYIGSKAFDKTDFTLSTNKVTVSIACCIRFFNELPCGQSIAVCLLSFAKKSYKNRKVFFVFSRLGEAKCGVQFLTTCICVCPRCSHFNAARRSTLSILNSSLWVKFYIPEVYIHRKGTKLSRGRGVTFSKCIFLTATCRRHQKQAQNSTKKSSGTFINFQMFHFLALRYYTSPPSSRGSNSSTSIERLINIFSPRGK